jgi:hypothetical protein
MLLESRLLFLKVAKDYMNTNLKFALSDEAEFADEIKSLGFEDDNAEVMVGCLTGKQRFKMAPKKGFESQDLVRFFNAPLLKDSEHLNTRLPKTNFFFV